MRVYKIEILFYVLKVGKPALFAKTIKRNNKELYHVNFKTICKFKKFMTETIIGQNFSFVDCSRYELKEERSDSPATSWLSKIPYPI